MGKIAIWALILVAIAVILAIIVLTSVYDINLSKITSTESNIEVLATLASIFVSITILIFVDIIRSEPWKKFKYNKITSIFIFLALIVAVYLLFGAGSTGIISSTSSMQSTILFMYNSISLCAVILIVLLLIYVLIQ